MQLVHWSVSTLAILVAIQSAGCASLQDGHYEKCRHLEAWQAWCDCGQAPDCYDTADYGSGWRAGYYDVRTGDSGHPPMFPPKRYWTPGQLLNRCDHDRHGWFVGYQSGAACARCKPDTHYLRPWPAGPAIVTDPVICPICPCQPAGFVMPVAPTPARAAHPELTPPSPTGSGSTPATPEASLPAPTSERSELLPQQAPPAKPTLPPVQPKLEPEAPLPLPTEKPIEPARRPYDEDVAPPAPVELLPVEPLPAESLPAEPMPEEQSPDVPQGVAPGMETPAETATDKADAEPSASNEKSIEPLSLPLETETSAGDTPAVPLANVAEQPAENPPWVIETMATPVTMEQKLTPVMPRVVPASRVRAQSRMGTATGRTTEAFVTPTGWPIEVDQWVPVSPLPVTAQLPHSTDPVAGQVTSTTANLARPAASMP